MTSIFRIGDSADEVVLKFATLFQQVEAFYFTYYFPSLGLEERISSSANANLVKIFNDARNLRTAIGPALPYWESIIATSSPTAEFALFAKESVRHSNDPQQRYEIKRTEINRTRLDKMIESMAEEQALAFCSICKLPEGITGFIPMMDFRIAPNPTNLEKMSVVIQEIGLPGLILGSGKSYHFFGTKLLTESEIQKFLGKCLLISPITDSRYIGHRMMEGSCDLRISTSKYKQTLPRVVKIFE
ncbi:MAG: hypothetical protein AABZ55_06555 [Bdellovibrionota bacterium]